MPSIQASSKLFDDVSVTGYFHVPGGTGAVICSPDGGTTKKSVDMRDYSVLSVVCIASVLVGVGVNLLEIVAAEDAAMATNLTVIKSSVITANVLGGKCGIECTDEEISGIGSPLGYKLRYAAARLTVANAGDKVAVTYIRSLPRFAYLGQTSFTPGTAD